MRAEVGDSVASTFFPRFLSRCSEICLVICFAPRKPPSPTGPSPVHHVSIGSGAASWVEECHFLRHQLCNGARRTLVGYKLCHTTRPP